MKCFSTYDRWQAGETIRRVRLLLGLTQREAAAVFGWPARRQQHIELGQDAVLEQADYASFIVRLVEAYNAKLRKATPFIVNEPRRR